MRSQCSLWSESVDLRQSWGFGPVSLAHFCIPHLMRHCFGENCCCYTFLFLSTVFIHYSVVQLLQWLSSPFYWAIECRWNYFFLTKVWPELPSWSEWNDKTIFSKHNIFVVIFLIKTAWKCFVKSPFWPPQKCDLNKTDKTPPYKHFWHFFPELLKANEGVLFLYVVWFKTFVSSLLFCCKFSYNLSHCTVCSLSELFNFWWWDHWSAF